MSGQALTFPAGFLVAGNMIRVTAAGWYSNETAKKPNITMGLYWGGVAGKVLLEASAVTSVEAAKEYPWRWESLTRVVAAGESGKTQSTGVVSGIETPTESATVAAGQYLMPLKSKTGAEQTINTATSNILTLGVKYSEKGGAAQELQCILWAIEVLN